MISNHRIYLKDSANMMEIPSSSVHLAVTSPPYPMIEMWDAMFMSQNYHIRKALKNHDGWKAFELMHELLDRVWKELYRILINGGIACINIGDATRTIGANFVLYPNHSRVLSSLVKTGFSTLPLILWRKPTNAPNKFMGSGMLPAGAYVTLEHEYILIVRKGGKREFNSHRDKQNRRESALFWEERNNWFSDVWLGLIGTQQKLKENDTRLRSGAFPSELSYRLINMYSVKGDTVVDPFLGTGTTMWAAIAAARNCIGFEIETGFQDILPLKLDKLKTLSNGRIQQRIHDHLDFVKARKDEKRKFNYISRNYKFPVMTRQEIELFFNPLEQIEQTDKQTLEVEYAKLPDRGFDGDWENLISIRCDKH